MSPIGRPMKRVWQFLIFFTSALTIFLINCRVFFNFYPVRMHFHFFSQHLAVDICQCPAVPTSLSIWIIYNTIYNNLHLIPKRVKVKSIKAWIEIGLFIAIDCMHINKYICYEFVVSTSLEICLSLICAL